METVAIVVLAIAVVVLAVALVTRRSAEDRTPRSPIDVSPEVGEVRPALSSRTVDGGGVEVVSGHDVLVSMRPLPSMPNGSRVSAPVRANAGFAAALLSLGGPAGALATAPGQYVVRFSPTVEQAIRRQSAALVRSAGQQLPIARDVMTGRYLEVGRLVRRSALSTMAPEMLLAASIVAVITVQLQQIQRTLLRIERGIGALGERMRDDDHGELEAANLLVEQLVGAIGRGGIPRQLELELAVARQRVEAVYGSRGRFIDRFRRDLERSQNEAESKTGEARAWSRDATQAFGDRDTFESEALLFAKAIVVRGRLAMCTAAAIALDGDPDTARSLMLNVQNSTLDEFHDFARRMKVLSRDEPAARLHRPELLDRKRKGLRELSGEIARMLEEEVAPSLPPRTPAELEFTMEIGAED